MTSDFSLHLSQEAGAGEQLPFPFNQRSFCRYEPIEKRVRAIRVMIVDNLLRDEGDLSETAKELWGRSAATHIQREREIAVLAMENIHNNVTRLVVHPETKIVHLSEAAEAAASFRPQAIVLSGTLRDFDFYRPEIIDNFCRFLRETEVPVLGICGGHQLVGLCFGARILTLDFQEQHERRENRIHEYQYRFVRITEPDDPIFRGINDRDSGVWQDYTKEARILRVWQNHGLQIDRVPEGFQMLATSYLCRVQMMVKRGGGQLIYTVQFHLEKSFEDWHKNRTRWEHPNESRDGRVIFENFLLESLRHGGGD